MSATINLRRGGEVVGEGPVTRVRTEAHVGWTSGWLASVSLGETTAKGPTMARAFLRPDEEDLSRAGNGSKEYEVGPGWYEAESVYRSGTAERHQFLIREDGSVEFFDDEAALFVALGRAAGRDLGQERSDALAKAMAQGAADAEELADLRLPALTGSEKQVRWAKDIRAKVLVGFKKDPSMTPERWEEIVEAARKVTEARWWIDARNYPLSAINRIVLQCRKGRAA